MHGEALFDQAGVFAKRCQFRHHHPPGISSVSEPAVFHEGLQVFEYVRREWPGLIVRECRRNCFDTFGRENRCGSGFCGPAVRWPAGPQRVCEGRTEGRAQGHARAPYAARERKVLSVYMYDVCSTMGALVEKQRNGPRLLPPVLIDD